VDRVILYGSRVTSKAHSHSDYDILVILKRGFDWRLKNRIYDATWEVDMDHDILTDIRFISLDEISTIKGFQPYVQEALERGIEL
jgi:predicted nucleotidyltransferase